MNFELRSLRDTLRLSLGVRLRSSKGLHVSRRG